MTEPHRVFLLPGFFGFTQLGEIVYFGHVRDFLTEELARRGVVAEVIPLVTPPTASVVTRVRSALEAIRARAGDSGPVHLVGHSTGGLDARLLISPGANLGGEPPPAALLDRVRSVVTVSTPHRGTPLASFFVGLAGQQVLKLLSAFTAAVLRRRELPLRHVFRLIGAFLRADDWISSRRTLLDQLFGDLLSEFSAVRRAALAEFFDRVGRDQALTDQDAGAFQGRRVADEVYWTQLRRRTH
jgi:pimeloyl-ACP methyl ester carboxylesterase